MEEKKGSPGKGIRGSLNHEKRKEKKLLCTEKKILIFVCDLKLKRKGGSLVHEWELSGVWGGASGRISN